MRLMRKALETISVGVFVGALAMAMPADARTIGGSAGRAVGGNQNTCFNVSTIPGSAGVSNVCAGAATLAIPLTFDNPGARTFFVTGQVNPGGSMQCQILTFTQFGGQGQFSAVMTFPANGVFTQRAAVANVPGSGTGFLFCLMSGNGTARVNVVDYLPS
jgi:hypothetical protein